MDALLLVMEQLVSANCRITGDWLPQLQITDIIQNPLNPINTATAAIVLTQIILFISTETNCKQSH